jgi:predicted nucleotide-binding protein
MAEKPCWGIGYTRTGDDLTVIFNQKVPPRNTEVKNVSGPDPKSAYVVHGRGELLTRELFKFLRALGLNPIQWQPAIAMTGACSPYIGQILDAVFNRAQAFVVLLSPDDEARLCKTLTTDDDPDYERELTPQARPNVLFEAGLAFGRNPNRVILVEVGTLRPFSNTAGQHAVKLDNGVRSRSTLATRLEIAGCKVERSGTDWLTAGDFEASLLKQDSNQAETMTGA